MFGFSGTRKWVYAERVTGHYQVLHRWSGRALLAFLVITPWLRIAGHPAVRIDLPARRVYALGTIFTAADGFLMVLMGLLAAFSLFFFTSLYGRLWCGYACPQTVFLEEFIRPIERFTEGDRAMRMKRDAGPWTGEKIARKAAKFAAFAAVAAFVSMSFQSWFAGAPEIWMGMAGPVDYTLVGIFSAGWFLDFAWFREQLCNYVCPYARFQGALADEESQVVMYDLDRGEPRGKAAKDRGGCIDCNKCVVVCPQGIDIRNGYQLECITCGRCIDACESVMGKLGHPTLVKYGTIAETQGKKPRLIRPRTVVYAGLLTAVSAAIVSVIAFHEPLEAHVQRAPGSLYTVDEDGWIRNTFMLKLVNNDVDPKPERFAVAIEGLEDAELIAPDVELGSTESRTVPLVVRVKASDDMPRTIPFSVKVSTDDGEVVQETTFKTPGAMAAQREE
jgi:cytochrome c oxidase accessory protein FixG